MNRASAGIACCAVLLLLPVQAPAAQQLQEGLRLELRLDGLGSAGETEPALHVGAGVARRFGMFQLGVAGGGGPSADGGSVRVEAFGRFHVDPFRQRSWGLYGVAGAGMLWADATEPFLLFAVGFEGRRGSGGWAPGLEVGLARGLRVAAVLRRTPALRR